MKVRFRLSIGYANAVRDEVVNIDDNDVAGFDEGELEDYLEHELDMWRNDYIDSGYEIIEQQS